VDAGLDLQVAFRIVAGKLVFQRGFDLTRQGVVTLDQIAVIAAHHPHEIGEASRGRWIEFVAETFGFACYLGDQIEDLTADGFRQAGFEAEYRFHSPILHHGQLAEKNINMAKNEVTSADLVADHTGDRIAKVIARAGICSRRDAEKLIAAGRVALDGVTINTPAIKVGENQVVSVDGKPLSEPDPARLWRYHKPSGLVTTHNDPKGRPTVFANLPKTLPRVVSIGRLDFNSEGLLLLTNDGEIARRLELPVGGWPRKYRVRLFGKVSQGELDKLAEGITLDGVKYGPIVADLERSRGVYSWATVTLKEGKNREVKRVMESLGLKVARLIRVQFGPFHLGQLAEGAVEEIPAKLWREHLGIGRKKHGREGA
jgi:23S rRNA pseudouridine2605 synthase